jgi:hypothetical protein
MTGASPCLPNSRESRYRFCMWATIYSHLKAESGAIKSAPIAFVVALGIGIAIGFALKGGLDDSELRSVRADREFWRDKAEDANIAPPIAATSSLPKSVQPENRAPTNAPNRGQNARVVPPTLAPPAAGRDNYTNSGVNNGIVGPVTLGKPQFILTEEILSEVVKRSQRGFPVRLQVVGLNERSERDGLRLQKALEAAGFEVLVSHVGFLIPVSERPLMLDQRMDGTAITLDPKA